MYIYLLLYTTIMFCFMLRKYLPKLDKFQLPFLGLTLSVIVINVILIYKFGNITLLHLNNSITLLFLIKYIALSFILNLTIIFIIKHFKLKKEKYPHKSIILHNLILLILWVIIFGLKYLLVIYKDVPPEQLAFHLQVPITGTSDNVIIDILKNLLTYPLIIMIFLNAQFLTFKYFKKKIVFNFSKKTFNIFPLRFYEKKYIGITLMIVVLFGLYAFKNYNIYDFIANQFLESKFIENKYVDPSSVNLTFPKEKRNLIYIFLESMETTYSEYTPNLYNLALTNTTFYNEQNGSFSELVGANWTIASMVAQTSGLPLKFSVDSSTYNADKNSFLNGIQTLGDVLLANDYKNYIMMGSNADFAYRRNYFTIHGNYEIFDYLTALNEDYIPDNYFEWWGFEDRKLYEFSKEKLTNISKKNEPFNFTILTVDTHYTDGYLDNNCPSSYEEQYANVLNCADNMLYEFIEWIKKQDFYKNTTIVISGDHLYMAKSDFFNKYNKNNRHIYNTIINPYENPKSNVTRDFTALDMFPTTLAAMGVKIENDKLGLGVNLFSNTKTLVEEFGIEKINSELKKKSTFYNNISLYNN